MAILYVSEYAELAKNSLGVAAQAPQEPALEQQAVTFTSGETDSAAFNANTKFIRVVSDTNCFVQFGATPTAADGDDSTYLVANVEYFFGVTGGHKVSALSA